ncbi:MAG: lamin tail domain-containing protein [Bacteroidales bacterium]
MKKQLVALLLLPLMALGQLNESFDDGDFTANPVWNGTTGSFMVNASNQLQLNASAEGNAYLSTAYESSGTTEWRFYIKQSFSPSANNFGEVYLSSDAADITGDINGYFLRFGESGSADAIELFRKSGSVETSICRGPDAQVSASFALWIKVIRTSNGEWSVYSDASGTGAYVLQASGTDNTFLSGGFFGFYCQFTASNSTKFYFDDIYAGSQIIDNKPPTVTSVDVIDPFTLEVNFSESVDDQSATTVLNYTADGGLGSPQQVTIADLPSLTSLMFAQSFENGRLNTLSISNISDLAGNIMHDTSVTFRYYSAQANELVINEIMADPSPVVGLPEWEYIELYNITNLEIDLAGWKLMIGETEKPIVDATIEANGYLILSHIDAFAELSVYGNTLGFSSFQLTNAGTSLKLISSEGITISEVAYSDSWYNDNTKKEGGWSLEQIDPLNACGGKNNWTASGANLGGSPGSLNSVDAPNNTSPKIEHFTLLTNNIIQLWFDQKMDNISLSNTDNYALNPGNIQPSSILLNELEPGFVQLVFDQVFAEGSLYDLNISTSVLNCSGQAVAENTFISFGIPNPVSESEILINEVLFNPLGDGVDFVELYNNTEKIFDIEQLMLGSVHQTIPNPPDTTLKVITENSRLILPKTYLLLSTSTNMVLSQYESPNPENFLEMSSFPTYSNDEGTVLLKSKTGKVIDVFSYSDAMHFSLLNTTEGVSLERISFETASSEITNWHSAAATAGYGTPGFQNSMTIEPSDQSDEIKMVPEIFSPNLDGYDDVTSLEYHFQEAGFTMNAFIFDANGIERRHLVKSTLIPADGSFFWDGLDENGNRVSSGIYIVAVEVFNSDGTVKNFKKPVVVVNQN